MPDSRLSALAPLELSAPARQFIDEVLALKLRVAVFDCDGTLWSGDGGKDFLYWEASNGVLPKPVAEWALPRYASYERGEVSEEQMCGEMVTLHRGLQTAAIEDAAERFFTEEIERRNRIFPEMQYLTRALLASGCQLWAVSSTNEWVIRAGVRRFGIPDEHVLAACVTCLDGLATDRLIRVPTDEGKLTAIRELIATPVEAVFGNSVHDAAMLAAARHAFAVNPNPDLKQLAQKKNWRIYVPDGTV
jgi:phosphoserine phosphatase